MKSTAVSAAAVIVLLLVGRCAADDLTTAQMEIGMYDFQMVENVNLAMNVLDSNLARRRPWRSETVVV